MTGQTYITISVTSSRCSSHDRRDQQRDGHEATLLGPRTIGPDALGTCLFQHIRVHSLGKLDVEFVTLSGCVVHQHDQLGPNSLYLLLLHQHGVLGVVPLTCQLVEPLLGLAPGLTCHHLCLGALVVVVVPPGVPAASNTCNTANGGLASGGVALQVCIEEGEEAVNAILLIG